MGIIHRYLGALAFAIFASARQRLDRKADKENVASQVLDSSQLWMYIIVWYLLKMYKRIEDVKKVELKMCNVLHVKTWRR